MYPIRHALKTPALRSLALRLSSTSSLEASEPLPGTLSKPVLLRLYRLTLKAAAKFPSIKRDQVIEDIKIEFHENASMTDPVKINQCHTTAQRSYGQLLGYCGLDEDDLEWSLTTAMEPMPQD